MSRALNHKDYPEHQARYPVTFHLQGPVAAIVYDIILVGTKGPGIWIAYFTVEKTDTQAKWPFGQLQSQ